VINQPLGTARTILQNEGFQFTVTQQQSSAAAQTVIGEIPPGGKKGRRGLDHRADGLERARVGERPVGGRGLALAGTQRADEGRPEGRPHDLPVERQFASGTVIDSSPSAGQPVPSGSSVTLVVSSGKAKVNVPDVTGENQQTAKSALTNAGFKVGAVTTQQRQPAPRRGTSSARARPAVPSRCPARRSTLVVGPEAGGRHGPRRHR